MLLGNDLEGVAGEIKNFFSFWGQKQGKIYDGFGHT